MEFSKTFFKPVKSRKII